MNCTDLVKNDAGIADIQKYPAGGEMTAITIRSLTNLRVAAKEAAAMHSRGFNAFVRTRLIEELKKGI